MRNNEHVRRRMANEHQILDELAKVMPPGQPTEGVSYVELAKQLGEGRHSMLIAKNSLEAAGVLETRITYPPGRGRMSTWELTMPLEPAHEELTREHERQIGRPSAKAQRRARAYLEGDSTTLEPLAPVIHTTPYDSHALIRAAREYTRRLEVARQHLKDLKDAGVEIDESSLSVRRDDRLEAIAQVLPAIDELERNLERAEDQARRWRLELDGVEQ